MPSQCGYRELLYFLNLEIGGELHAPHVHLEYLSFGCGAGPDKAVEAGHGEEGVFEGVVGLTAAGEAEGGGDVVEAEAGLVVFADG